MSASKDVPRKPKRPAGTVSEWLVFLRRAARADHIRAPDNHLVRLAGLLAIVGGPDVERARDHFHAIRGLFFRQARVPRWGKAAGSIPADPAMGLERITACAREYGKVTDVSRLFRGKIRLDQVVRVMVQIGDAEAYMWHAARSDFLNPHALFHPNTLAAARRRVRGALGTLSRDAGEHGAQIEAEVRTVSGGYDDD